MEQYISISQINDFLYSPASLYMHSAFVDYDEKLYKEKAQINGTIKHEAVDNGTYSTSKHIITGKMVYSKRFGFVGKIDIYDSKRKLLIERKARITKIHRGYLYQLYAQMYAMEEMVYDVFELALHSLEDNKRYIIPLPNVEEESVFAWLIKQIHTFKPEDLLKKHSDMKSNVSIYAPLAW